MRKKLLFVSFLILYLFSCIPFAFGLVQERTVIYKADPTDYTLLWKKFNEIASWSLTLNSKKESLSVIETSIQSNKQKITLNFEPKENGEYIITFYLNQSFETCFINSSYHLAFIQFADFIVFFNWSDIISLSLENVFLEPSYSKEKIFTFKINVNISKIEKISLDPTVELQVEDNDHDCFMNGSDEDYATAWATALYLYDYATAYYSLAFGQRYMYEDSKYRVWRAFLKIDTTLPENAVIESAKLCLYGVSDYSDYDFYINVQRWTGDVPITLGDFLQWDGVNYDDGTFTTANFVIADWNNITIQDLDLINATGYTKICLRSSEEIEEDPPYPVDITQYVYVRASEYSGGAYAPMLVITYSMPFTVTLYFTPNYGFFWVDRINKAYGSSVLVANNTIIELTAIVKNASYYWLNFTVVGGSTYTENPSNHTVLSDQTIWCYFATVPEGDGGETEYIYVDRWFYGLFILGLAFSLIFALLLSKDRL